MLESAINHFSEDELWQGNGIQSVINKLQTLKYSACPKQILAVKDFAERLAMIDSMQHKGTARKGEMINKPVKLKVIA